MMVILRLMFVAFIISNLNHCQPFRYTWYRWDNQQDGKCGDIEAQTFAYAGLNIALDLVTFYMPIPRL
jgi:hypothetical protein